MHAMHKLHITTSADTYTHMRIYKYTYIHMQATHMKNYILYHNTYTPTYT